MSAFDPAYDKIIKGSEGGYVNDPDDKGGETYAGITRKNYPNWPGWLVIDDKKEVENFELELRRDDLLPMLVKEFYKKEYWDKFYGDVINPFIAEELFDQSVNFGMPRAIEHLQRTINILNKNAKSYADIKVDKNFGSGTLNALKKCIEATSIVLVVNVLNGYQIKKYLEIMEANPTQEKYVGWFSRVQFIKD